MIDIVFISIILLFHINYPISTFYRKNNPTCAILAAVNYSLSFTCICSGNVSQLIYNKIKYLTTKLKQELAYG